MEHYESTAVIDASPEAIWTVLTDAPAYADWDSGVVRVEGTIAPQEKIKVVSEANPKRAFPVKVTEFAPGERMVWSGGMPLGLFKGRAHVQPDARGRRDALHHARGVQRADAAADLALDARPRPELRAVRERAEGTRRRGRGAARVVSSRPQ